MVLTVEVISREMVKPSSPTPDRFRRYQFSFLDQISPPVFMPMAFFYPSDPENRFSHAELSYKLKQSLSETLVLFYPLAGRAQDELYIDCNDEGVPYVEARVKGQLAKVIRDPVPKELNKLHAYELDDVRDLVVAVQVSFFDCGGVAVGVLISHKVADALSYFFFVNSWAATARGDVRDIIAPQFGLDALFPPRNVGGFKTSTGIVKDNIVTKRFVFSASVVASLRAKYSDCVTEEDPIRPTRVEALSTFLWTRYMAAIKEDINPNSIYTLLHAVNLRPRINPPVPNHFFGNIFRLAIAVPSRGAEQESYEVLNHVRDAIRKVNGDYITKLQEGSRHLDFLKNRSEGISRGDVVSLSFSSWCRFPIYEADFGWGKPIWAGSASLTFKNLIVFTDTSSGDGIEALVHLTEANMAKFEKDEEFLSLVSPPPSARLSDP